GKFVTNVAQGGKVYTLDHLLSAMPDADGDQVKDQLVCFALDTARHLSRYLPHIADLGLDVGITRYGYPVFIESNGKDLRYSFAEGNMHEAWKNTYRNPIGYGRYLLDR